MKLSTLTVIRRRYRSCLASAQFTHAAKEDFNDHTGFTSLFDGKTLNGWDGDTEPVVGQRRLHLHQSYLRTSHRHGLHRLARR